MHFDVNGQHFRIRFRHQRFERPIEHRSSYGKLRMIQGETSCQVLLVGPRNGIEQHDLIMGEGVSWWSVSDRVANYEKARVAALKRALEQAFREHKPAWKIAFDAYNNHYGRFLG